MKIAVLLPCHNEGAAIYQVAQDFRKALPEAAIYVYDNNSTDNTADEARRGGAIVRRETRKGKGFVVQRMFANINADIYVLADGDGTYDSSAAPAMVRKLIDENLDMVVGVRVPVEGQDTYRKGHRFGNRLITWLVSFIFGKGCSDIFSGYRVMSRRFVKSFPAVSRGFEIETEMTVHALSLHIPFDEVDAPYFERAKGTASKLRTYHDGFRILNFIMILFKEIRPFMFFGLVALALMLLSIGISLPVIAEFMDTGLVPRFPTVVLSVAIMLCGAISFVCGIILDSVSRGRREFKRHAYLNCE